MEIVTHSDELVSKLLILTLESARTINVNVSKRSELEEDCVTEMK